MTAGLYLEENPHLVRPPAPDGLAASGQSRGHGPTESGWPRTDAARPALDARTGLRTGAVQLSERPGVRARPVGALAPPVRTEAWSATAPLVHPVELVRANAVAAVAQAGAVGVAAALERQTQRLESIASGIADLAGLLKAQEARAVERASVPPPRDERLFTELREIRKLLERPKPTIAARPAPRAEISATLGGIAVAPVEKPRKPRKPKKQPVEITYVEPAPPPEPELPLAARAANLLEAAQTMATHSLPILDAATTAGAFPLPLTEALR